MLHGVSVAAGVLVAATVVLVGTVPGVLVAATVVLVGGTATVLVGGTTVVRVAVAATAVRGGVEQKPAPDCPSARISQLPGSPRLSMVSSTSLLPRLV